MRPGDSDVSDWWTTAIIDMAPGRIRMRGHPIETLIGKLGFAEMIWLMTRGDIPTPGQARIFWTARWWQRWITGRKRLRSPRRAWR
jgi:citrate synthase